MITCPDGPGTTPEKRFLTRCAAASIGKTLMETHHRVFWWAAVWDRPWPHLGPALALVLLEIDDVVSGFRSDDRDGDFRR
jgi:hypothetical protein